jgi:putative transposase
MYDASKHRRRSIRLPHYDYAQPGLYFITICCHEKKCRFGHIQNDEMILNDCGKIAEQEWQNLLLRFPALEADVFQMMPNHIHGIIHIQSQVENAATCGDIIGAYKSLVFYQCLAVYKAASQLMGKLWQRNYYEHIIRSSNSYDVIYNYIINNPQTWSKDTFYVPENDD